MNAPQRSYRFVLGEVFPADEPVARWLMTMSVGLNDVVFANARFEDGGEDYAQVYFFRLACAHLWEVAKFITEAPAGWDEIREFIDSLPDDARRQLEAIEQIVETGTVATIGKELVQIRDQVAHYQEMDAQARARPRDPITKAMEALAGGTMELEVGERVRDLRLGYADRVIDQTLIRLAPDDGARRRVFAALGEGLGHVIQFVQLALNVWLEPRLDRLELDITEPE